MCLGKPDIITLLILIHYSFFIEGVAGKLRKNYFHEAVSRDDSLDTGAGVG